MEINKNYRQELIKLRQDSQSDIGRLSHWWRAQDRRYRWVWRAGNGIAAVLVLASVALPVISDLNRQSQYRLSAATLNLVGKTDQTLTKQLSYDPSKQLYQFNKDAVKSSYDPLAVLKNQVGTASGGKDKPLYALDVPQNLSQGVTYHDTNSQLSFGLKPEFKSSQGQVVDGHLVYPLDGGKQAIYTLKNNGLKEDIVIPQTASDTMSFNYELDLPKTLEAKVIPGSGGAIGIYSADPSLFGDISYGSTKDQALIEKARENGDKTYLVFGLPAPTIKAADGASVGDASARFELNSNQLTVVAEHLSGIKTPITIDPSVVVTSATDFQTSGNNEGNIDFDATNNRINRGGLTGGSISGGWTSTTGFTSTSSRMYHGSVAYNGYLYLLGGYKTSLLSDTLYAQLNSDGSITSGAWQASTSLPSARYGFATVVYNGYLYALGGCTAGAPGSCTARSNSILSAPIASNGTIGTWTTLTTTMPYSAEGVSAVAYNGNLYLLGGYDGATYRNSVQHIALNADGTVASSWTSDTGFTTGRTYLAATEYNGTVYILGGNSGASELSDVQYAPVSSTGAITSWIAATSFSSGRDSSSVEANDGYLYLMGGSNTGNLNDVQYAPINANGSLGTWQTSSSFTTTRNGQGGAIYNGYLYISGGTSTSGNGNLSDVQYAKIDPAGITGSFSNESNNFTTGRALNCATAYNGYLYVMGGSTNDSATNLADIQYTAINSDGSLAGWGSTNGLPSTNNAQLGCIAFNGHMYVVGGAGTGQGNVVSYANFNSSGGGLNNTWTSSALPSSETVRYTQPVIYSDANGFNAYMYIVGGKQTVGGNVKTYVAPLAANGAPGTWSTSSGTSDLPTNYYASAITIVGNYIYRIGGTTGGATFFQEVDYAPIAGDGTLGAWTRVTTSPGQLPVAVGYAQATTVNGCIYVVGGENSGGNQNKVYYTCPNNNGSIPSTGWQSAPNLQTTLTDFGLANANGYLFVVGGATSGSTVTNATQYASVNNGGGGGVGTWSTASHSFTALSTTGRVLGGSVAYNGYLYFLGGQNGSTSYATVYYAPIQSNGDLGTWLSASHSLPQDRYAFGVTAYNGFLYVVGGYGNSGGLSPRGNVAYAALASNGDVGAWTTGPSLTTPRAALSVTAYNGYLYAIGGYNLGSTFYINEQHIVINSNGSVGASWSTEATPFTNVRAGAAAVAYNGYMYFVGGFNASSTEFNDVQYAPINANGSLGTSGYTAPFNMGRDSMAVSVYNGNLYLSGGSAINAYNDTQYAQINANGTLSNWQYAFTTFNGTGGRWGLESAIYNGYMYILGGENQAGNTYFTDNSYAPLATTARVGSYSKLIDFGGSVNVSSITYNGTLPGNSSVAYRTAGSNGVFGSSALASSLAGSTACTGSTTPTRYVWVLVTLDDTTFTGAFPDANSTPANLTDYTINYNSVHPAPGSRLRMGQTLQNGNLSVLDTCSP